MSVINMEKVCICFDFRRRSLLLTGVTPANVGNFPTQVKRTDANCPWETLCDQVIAICKSEMKVANPKTVPINIDDGKNQFACDQSAAAAASFGGVVAAAASMGPSPKAAPKKAAPKAGAKKAATKSGAEEIIESCADESSGQSRAEESSDQSWANESCNQDRVEEGRVQIRCRPKKGAKTDLMRTSASVSDRLIRTHCVFEGSSRITWPAMR